MPQHFTSPHVPKPHIKRFKIDKKYTAIDVPKQTAKTNVASWWDYLLACNNTTRTDRNTIYWKYKAAFDNIGCHPSDVLTFKYSHLSDDMKRLLNLIYKKEIP